MKVFACESGVDKQTLKHCFQAFNLTLENSDYYRPNLPETNSINPQLLPELPEGQVPLDSPFYIHRNNLEQTCYQEILRGGSLIRINAARKMGKTSLITRIINYAQQQQYHTLYFSFRLAESSIFRFFRTYTVENSPSSLSVQQCSKVDKYQSNKNSKPYYTSFTSMSW
jgi:hypothetical protein